jgi:Tfp pilus assembly protein PilN
VIKINLAKVQKAGVAAGAGIPSLEGVEGFTPISDEEIRKQAFLRILVLLLFPGILYAIEFQSIPTKKNLLSVKQEQLNQLVLKNESAKKAAEDIKVLGGQQKALQDKIDFVESLKKGRMREVQVLDSIQRMTPNKVWLQKLDVINGQLSLTGYSVTDAALTSFMDSMARSIYLKDVSLVRSNEYVEEMTGLTVKKFEVSSALEVAQ